MNQIPEQLIKDIYEGLADCSFEGQVFAGEDTERMLDDYASWDIFERYYSGATKIVLTFREYEDYVIKLPFTCDECGESFFCAEEPDEWNYCEAESIFYEHAEDEGLEDVFLESRLCGHIGGHPFYIQKKAIVLEEIESSSPKDNETLASARNCCCENNIYNFNTYWIADFIEYYGIEKLSLLNKFIKSFGISDLHGGNLGYVGKRPVIIDYAGYHEY